MQRTVKDLINNISRKFDIDPHRVTQVTHVNSRGVHIMVDESMVRELPEGQDMIVEFVSVQTGQPINQEFIAVAITEAVVDGEIIPAEVWTSDSLEMRLNF
jgi:hypothetical protein